MGLLQFRRVLKMPQVIDTVRSDSLMNAIDAPMTKNIATGGLPPEFFLGTILFMIMILIFLIVIKIQELQKK
jgi:hypothetical protein